MIIRQSLQTCGQTNIIRLLRSQMIAAKAVNAHVRPAGLSVVGENYERNGQGYRIQPKIETLLSCRHEMHKRDVSHTRCTRAMNASRFEQQIIMPWSRLAFQRMYQTS